MNGSRALEIAAAAALLVVGGGMFFRLSSAPPPEVKISGYATSLKGRTPSQRHNAQRAAEMLDGRVISPGEIFSFNKVVRSWAQDTGYVKAPVSYDGELIKAYGGGVCQTSTTLYNAALLAGLPIIERHPHVFAPHYVPPGRDAAVAQYTIDLRFRNPYKWPIRIRANAQGDTLDIRLCGAKRPEQTSQVTSDILEKMEPQKLTRVAYRVDSHAGSAYLRNPGAVGYRVVTYRSLWKQGHEVSRERLGDDTYQSMNQIVQVDEVAAQ